MSKVMTKSTSKATKKQEFKKKMENMIPVFKLKPVGSDRALCKYYGLVSKDENLFDEQIELYDKDGKELEGIYAMGSLRNYEICVKACACNIVGDYLLKNNKLPIYYMTLMYNRTFVSGYIFTIFINFTISDESLKDLVKIDTTTGNVTVDPAKYVNKLFIGKYTLELVSDDDFLAKYIEYVQPTIESEFMEEYLEEFENANDDIRSQIMEKIAARTTEKLDEYRNLFEPVSLNTINRKKLVRKMIEIYEQDNMRELIKFGLEMREKERIKKSCPDQDYKIPKNIISLKELKDNPDKLDENIDKILEHASDNSDDSDDS